MNPQIILRYIISLLCCFSKPLNCFGFIFRNVAPTFFKITANHILRFRIALICCFSTPNISLFCISYKKLCHKILCHIIILLYSLCTPLLSDYIISTYTNTIYIAIYQMGLRNCQALFCGHFKPLERFSILSCFK